MTTDFREAEKQKRRKEGNRQEGSYEYRLGELKKTEKSRRREGRILFKE